jgi:hypothetical protein
VERDILVKIIKEDFGLTIDIEALIEKYDSDGTGQMEFEEVSLYPPPPSPLLLPPCQFFRACVCCLAGWILLTASSLLLPLLPFAVC